jgi:hypothetical protein
VEYRRGCALYCGGIEPAAGERPTMATGHVA